jgi:hypothetical protein
LYSDPNFAPAWPLLPDASGSMGMGAGGDGWMGDDQTELGALRYAYTFTLVSHLHDLEDGWAPTI